MRRTVAAMALGVLVACGSGSDGGAGDPEAAPAAGGPAAPEQQAMPGSWVPLDPNAPARESDADFQVCAGKVNEDPRLDDPQDLRRLSALIHCMRSKGWEYKPES